MSNYVDGLREKLELLQEQKDALEIKMATIQELLDEELGETSAKPSATLKRKPGRPKGSVAKAAPVAELSDEGKAIHAEAESLGGTDPELAKRLASRFRPVPRSGNSYGHGVKLDSKNEVDRKRRGDASDSANHISIEEEPGGLKND